MKNKIAPGFLPIPHFHIDLIGREQNSKPTRAFSITTRFFIGREK
jgi:hypothetical protein